MYLLLCKWAQVTLLTSSIYKHMKRAATQLFKRQSKIALFSKLSMNYNPLADPRARQRSENRTPGTTRMCELGCPGAMVKLGTD